MPVLRIADADDPRLADYRGVPEPELLERHGIFVAEGRLVVRRLLTSSRFTPRSVMVTDTAHASLADVLGGTDLPVYVVPQPLMAGITGFNIHRGCLAIGERRPEEDWRALAHGARRLVVLERVGNADNVGSVFRNAAAFKADAVLLGPACADPLYRKAVRTSMGAALTVPFAHCARWPDTLHDLGDLGFAVIGMTPDPAAARLDDVIASTPARAVAIVLGHEADGLTAEALGACGHRGRVPMAGGVDSLNVATAAAIALYEVARAPNRDGAV